MDDRALPDEALQFDTTFTNAAATAPRRRPAEQTGFGSGGTTSSSSTRSSKRQRGSPAQCPPGSYFDGSSIYTNPKDPHRGEGKQTGRHYDLSHSREQQPGFDSRVSASQPRQNDSQQTGSRRDPRSTSRAEQSKFASSYSNRSCKRQRTNSSDDHDDHAIGRGDHDDEPEDVLNQYYRQHRVLLAASAPSTRGTLHDDRQHQQRATNANYPRGRSAGTASGPTQPAAQTHAGSRQERPRRHHFFKRTKKKKQSQPKQGWDKGVSSNAVW